MRVLCAWCLKAGKSESEALIGEKEPLADEQASHGICPEHRHVVEEALEQRRREVRELEDEHQRKARELQDELKALRDRVDP